MVFRTEKPWNEDFHKQRDDQLNAHAQYLGHLVRDVQRLLPVRPAAVKGRSEILDCSIQTASVTVNYIKHLGPCVGEPITRQASERLSCRVGWREFNAEGIFMR